MTPDAVVFVSAANRPVGWKLGFCLSGAGEVGLVDETALLADVTWLLPFDELLVIGFLFSRALSSEEG